MIAKGIQPLYNGHEVIAFTNKEALGKSIKSMQDLPSMYSWYKEDPDKNHLGMMKFWKYKTTRPDGIFDELLNTKSVLEVNGWNGGFTYDLPVETKKGLYTTKDMTHQNYAGIDGGTFTIVVNKELSVGHIITYDRYKGMQLIVVEEEVEGAPKQVAEGWEVTVQLVTNNKSHYFPKEFLAKGVYYTIINGTVDGERGTKFVGFEFGDSAETMRLEFRLGSMTAVESYITGMADSKSFSGADAQSREFVDKVTSEFRGNDIVLIQEAYKQGDKFVRRGKPSLGATMEYLTLRETHRLTNSKLMWQSAATIRNTNGVTRLNEGLYKQMLRGTIYKYGRKGGITKQHLANMADYTYRNNPYLDEELRHMEFRCGKYAFRNVLEIFEKDVLAQLTALSMAGLMGTDRAIPNPVQGNDPNNLALASIRFVEVQIKGIGNLRIVHDKSLDVMDDGMDRRAKGDNSEGLAPTAYSIFVTDVADQRYSNNKELPKGTKLIEDGNESANIYLVKPEGEMTYWGTSNGRYDYRRSGDIVSSMKQIGQEFWAFNIMDIVLMDPSRVIILELDERLTSAYNF